METLKRGEMPKFDSRTCTIKYTTSFLEGLAYGERFNGLDNCCDLFREWFFITGNSKVTSFNSVNEPTSDPRGKNGFLLVGRGNKFSLFLRNGNSETEIKFCPFCGAKVLMQNTKRVNLKNKTKTVPDGFDESDTQIIYPIVLPSIIHIGPTVKP